MNTDERIRNRLDELIKMGETVLATAQSHGNGIVADDYLDEPLAYQWATSVQNLLVRVFGQDSEHYKNFTAEVHNYITFSPASRAQGILYAAKDDYDNGQLFELRHLVEAELFDDFLEQAEYLLDSGYHQAAAVVAGCVLEDGLRKLCRQSEIPLPSKPKLDAMNIALAKAGTFSKLVQKRITALADLRNLAAHSQWDKFDIDDVKEMVKSVRRLMEEHFA